MMGADGRESRSNLEIVRDDFWVTASNKQLNLEQHIKTIVDINGRAAVVLPDNVLFFDKKPASESAWTKDLWVYDFGTNEHYTMKQNTLRRDHRQNFVDAFMPGKRDERVE